MSNKPNDIYLSGNFDEVRDEKRLLREASILIGRYNMLAEDMIAPIDSPAIEPLRLHTIMLDEDRRLARIRFLPLQNPLSRVAFKIATDYPPTKSFTQESSASMTSHTPSMDVALN